MAYDWSSSNWYFLDSEREAIYLCSSVPGLQDLRCEDVVSVRLERPTGIALDPVEGRITVEGSEMRRDELSLS